MILNYLIFSYIAMRLGNQKNKKNASYSTHCKPITPRSPVLEGEIIIFAVGKTVSCLQPLLPPPPPGRVERLRPFLRLLKIYALLSIIYIYRNSMKSARSAERASHTRQCFHLQKTLETLKGNKANLKLKCL